MARRFSSVAPLFAQLPHKTQIIAVSPMLDNLPIGNAKDVDARCCRLLATGWVAKERAKIRAAGGKALHHLVIFDDDILGIGINIREGLVENPHPLSHSVTAWR